jgi:Lar family restriction alleviation protein
MKDKIAEIEKLLPCPFCGGEADLQEISSGPFGDGFCSAGCNLCNIGWHKDTKEEAIAAWNQRAYLEQGQELEQSDKYQAHLRDQLRKVNGMLNDSQCKTDMYKNELQIMTTCRDHWKASYEKHQRDWECFREAIAPLIDCEPGDIQDMDYVLNSVARMQKEERNYSSIADELVEREAQLEQAQADNAALLKNIQDACRELDNSESVRGFALNRLVSATIKPHPGAALLEELGQLREINTELEATNKAMLDFGMDGRCPDEWACSGVIKSHDVCRKCWAEYFQKQTLAQSKASTTCNTCETSNECGGVQGECPFEKEGEKW